MGAGGRVAPEMLDCSGVGWCPEVVVVMKY